jgi:glycosyltransferase involved in cell wall biosynthesis
MPTLSVVITAHEEGALLKEAFESVRAQSTKPHEVVIVNDGSQHKATNEVCRSLEAAGLARIIWLANNGGTSVARNAGFAAATGEVLVPLDGDDLLPPHALASINTLFEANSEADFIHGSYLKEVSPSQKQVIRSRPISLRSLLRPKLLSLGTPWILHGNTPIKRAFWQRVGDYDVTLGTSELHDVDFWIRALSATTQWARTDEVIYIWRRYLGKNSAQISPASWARLASKHLSAFSSCGLRHRAEELLMLGAMWEKNKRDVRLHRTALLLSVAEFRFSTSTLVFLVSPAWLFRLVVRTFKPYTS